MSTTISFQKTTSACPRCRVPDAVLTNDGICHDCDQHLADRHPRSHVFSLVREVEGEEFDITTELDWERGPAGEVFLHPFGALCMSHQRLTDGRIVIQGGKRIKLTPEEERRAISEINRPAARSEETPARSYQPGFARFYGYDPEAGERISDFIGGRGHVA